MESSLQYCSAIPTFKTWVEEQWGQESVIEGSVDEIKEGKEHDQQDEEKEYLDTNVDMWNNYEENMNLDMDDIEKSLGKQVGLIQYMELLQLYMEKEKIQF